MDYRFGFNGQEKVNEIAGIGNHLNFGARGYDSRIARWWSVDPLAGKYPSWSPYVFALNNPINLTDPDGREPIKPLVGTIDQALGYFKARGFTTVAQMDAFYKNPVNEDGEQLDNYVRYVYTERNGWIDMRHYFGTILNTKVVMNALEVTQTLAGYSSSYSYEDLPSNAFGSDAPVRNKVVATSPNGKYRTEVDVLKQGDELFNSIEGHFKGAGATNPRNAPNCSKLPRKERPKVPDFVPAAPNSRSGINRPLGSKEKHKLIETGDYVPQNFSETPYDLNNFPTPSKDYLQR